MARSFSSKIHTGTVDEMAGPSSLTSSAAIKAPNSAIWFTHEMKGCAREAKVKLDDKYGGLGAGLSASQRSRTKSLLAQEVKSP